MMFMNLFEVEQKVFKWRPLAVTAHVEQKTTLRFSENHQII